MEDVPGLFSRRPSYRQQYETRRSAARYELFQMSHEAVLIRQAQIVRVKPARGIEDRGHKTRQYLAVSKNHDIRIQALFQLFHLRPIDGIRSGANVWESVVNAKQDQP